MSDPTNYTIQYPKQWMQNAYLYRDENNPNNPIVVVPLRMTNWLANSKKNKISNLAHGLCFKGGRQC